MDILATKQDYATRPIRFLGETEANVYRWKNYSITYDAREVSPEFLANGERIVAEVAARIRDDTTKIRYGMGFIIFHAGRGCEFLCVGIWQEENELHLESFSSPPGEPEQLAPTSAHGAIACVWDLRVIAHETEAWRRHLLQATGNEVSYLQDGLNEDV